MTPYMTQSLLFTACCFWPIADDQLCLSCELQLRWLAIIWWIRIHVLANLYFREPQKL